MTRAWFAGATSLEPSLIGSASFDTMIAQRIRELGLRGDADYAERLRIDSTEAARAHAMVAVPETWLFRCSATFETLRERLLRRRMAGQETVRALSAGCATGAEPWSLAVTFAAAGFPVAGISIDAVDLNPDALDAVPRGRFGRLGVREAIPAWAQHFVRSEREDLVVDPSLRATITVRRADLFTFSPLGCYDVILCRNVLIYLAKPARERLVRRLVSWLTPDGTLGTGHADNAIDHLEDLAPFGPTGAFLFERAALPSGHVPMSVPSAPPSPPPGRREAPRVAVAAATAPRAGSRSFTRRDELDVALRREPNRLDLLLELAELHVAAGEIARAEDAFRRIVYLDAKHEHALVRLAELAERQGKSELAARFRGRALEAHLEREE